MQSASRNDSTGRLARTHRIGWFVAALALVVGIVLIYSGVGSFGFVLLDDNAYVFDNQIVKDGLTSEGARWALTQAHSNNWHPLTWMSHMLDVELFGLDAGAHHWVNVALHALAALLLLLLCKRMGLGLLGAWLVAALFAWHPLRVESVAWISERKDVLSGVFGLLALHAYLSFGRQGGRARYGMVLVLLVLGLLSKPMLVTLPVVFLLLDLWPLERWSARTAGKLIREKVPFLALALVSGLVTIAIQSRSGAVQGFEAIPMLPRLENAAWTVLVYPAQTLFPRGLGVLYPHPALAGVGARLHAQALGAVVIILLVSWAAWKRRTSSPWLLMGWLWYLVMLAPVVGVLQVGGQAHADRYTYLPTIGLFLALAVGLERSLARRMGGTRRLWIVSSLLLLLLAGLANRQTQTWRDSEALFRRSNQVTGGNYTAHLNLGLWLREHDRLEDALRETRAAVRLEPSSPEAQYNLGVQELAAGNIAAAVAAFEGTLRADPDDADAHNRLAQVEFSEGNYDEAAGHFERAVACAPERFDLQSNLARFLAARGEWARARTPFERALALSPGSMPSQDVRFLARARAADGDPAAAVELLRQERAQRPGDPALAIDLAWILATTQDKTLRNPAEALDLVRKLLQAPGAPRAELLPLLAAARAASGDFPGALDAQEQALDLAAPQRRPMERERLELYRRGQALRLSSPW